MGLSTLVNIFILITLVSLRSASGRGYMARKHKSRHARHEQNERVRADRAWEDKERDAAKVKAFEISRSLDYGDCVLLLLTKNDRRKEQYLFCAESSEQMKQWIAFPGFGYKFVFQMRVENGRPQWQMFSLQLSPGATPTAAEWATTTELRQLIQNYVDAGHAAIQIKALDLARPRKGYKIRESPGTLVQRNFNLASVPTSETGRELQKYRHPSYAQAGKVQCPPLDKMKRCDAIGDQRSEECCLSKCVQKKPDTVDTMERWRLCRPGQLEGYMFHEFQESDSDSCKYRASDSTKIGRLAKSMGARLGGESKGYRAVCNRVHDAAAQQELMDFDEADEEDDGSELNQELEDVLREMFMAGFNRGLHQQG